MSCLVSTLCMTSAAIVAFILSRYIFRNFFKAIMIKRFPKFYIYDRAIECEGARFVFLMQFSIVPYSLLCYLIGGLTKVNLCSFFLGVLGMSIPNLLWAYTGSFINSLTDIKNNNEKQYL